MGVNRQTPAGRILSAATIVHRGENHARSDFSLGFGAVCPDRSDASSCQCQVADRWFLENLVRIHRAGEGASYDGIKPTGTALDPKVMAADRAMESGDLKPLTALVPADKHDELRRRFEKARALQKFDVDDVAAGRAYIAAYVTFYKYAEGEEHAHHHHH